MPIEEDIPPVVEVPAPPAPPDPPALPPVEPIDPLDASLEWLCEETVKREMLCDPRLAGFEIRHHGEAMPSAVDVFVVKAERGFARTDGIQGFDLTITVTFATAEKSAKEMDKVAAATIESIYRNPQSDNLDVSDLPLEGMYIEPGTITKRDDGEKTRKRIVTIPIIAKRANL